MRNWGSAVDKHGNRIALGDRVRLPDGSIESVVGFTPEREYVIHGSVTMGFGWETRAEFLERL